MPGGSPGLVERPTSALNPPIALTITTAVLDWPCWTLMLEGFTVMLKSCCAETCRASPVKC